MRGPLSGYSKCSPTSDATPILPLRLLVRFRSDHACLFPTSCKGQKSRVSIRQPGKRLRFWSGERRHCADSGNLVRGGRVGVFVSRNLTSDDETGVGKWTETQIVNALRNGRRPTVC
jgi:hypothetical protein